MLDMNPTADNCRLSWIFDAHCQSRLHLKMTPVLLLLTQEGLSMSR